MRPPFDVGCLDLAEQRPLALLLAGVSRRASDQANGAWHELEQHERRQRSIGAKLRQMRCRRRARS